MRRFITLTAVAAALGVFVFGNNPAGAATTCTFTTSGTTMSLDADCTTDATILVTDGFTLDGQGNLITAMDPGGGHFLGAVVKNSGSVAHVIRLVINTDNLVNVCDGGADRLRGIMFDGASGSITHSTIQGINQGASGCQEGNAIEVRHAPFNGAHPDTKTVEIAHNLLEDWQKTGIVCNGDVDCWVHHNMIGESATQVNLAANSFQAGFGAIALLEYNHIAGNQWLGASNFAATAVLHFEPSETTLRRNNIGGNADVGIFLVGGGGTVDNNRVFETGVDGPHGDFGIFSFGPGNEITNNKVRGYDFPAGEFPDSGEITGTKVVPAPQDMSAACFLPDTSAQACP